MKPSSLAISVAILVAVVITACSQKSDDANKSATSAAPAIAPFPGSAGVKPFSIGALQAAALSDGELSTPNDNKTLAINKTKAEVDALLTANNLPTDELHLSVQPLIVKTRDKVLLFDTGAASLFGPTLGKFPANLAAAGVDPANVTDIFIS